MTASLPPCARLPLHFDAQAMLDALSTLPPTAWEPHFNQGYYQGDWSGVALRTPVDARLSLAPGDGEARDTDYLDDFWRAQLARFRTALRSVRLLRLGPGGAIREHCDHDLGQPDADLRLHVPIVTDAQVDFLLDGARVPMRAGECWFLDLSRPHRVENHGGADRIHLVLDARPSAWLHDQIAAGSVDTPARQPSRGSLALERFGEHLGRHPALEAELAGLDDPQAFTLAVLAHAEALGLRFTAADLDAAMARRRRAWRASERA
ncbi:MAG: aspartyl/asparaginyl beta-hydroxylase domain-containing protein [Pseudomonadota bacterium]